MAAFSHRSESGTAIFADQQIGGVRCVQGSICVVVIAAVVAVVAATIAWLCLIRPCHRFAPNIVDLFVVMSVTLAAAITVSGPVL